MNTVEDYIFSRRNRQSNRPPSRIPATSMKVRGDMADYTKGQPGTSGFKNENLEVEGDKADIKGQPGSSVFRTGNGSTKIRKDLAAYTNVQPGPSALRNAYASRQRLPPLEQILPLPPADPNCVCGCFFF